MGDVSHPINLTFLVFVERLMSLNCFLGMAALAIISIASSANSQELPDCEVAQELNGVTLKTVAKRELEGTTYVVSGFETAIEISPTSSDVSVDGKNVSGNAGKMVIAMSPAKRVTYTLPKLVEGAGLEALNKSVSLLKSSPVSINIAFSKSGSAAVDAYRGFMIELPEDYEAAFSRGGELKISGGSANQRIKYAEEFAISGFPFAKKTLPGLSEAHSNAVKAAGGCAFLGETLGLTDTAPKMKAVFR